MKRIIGYGLTYLATSVVLAGCNLIVFNPKGQVAKDERDLIILATGLMLLVVIPVIVMMFLFAWRYRATNKKPGTRRAGPARTRSKPWSGACRS